MKVTLSDIAKATGYSINTVSHALNGKTDIAEKTRSYICKTAKELGYIANYTASSMRTGKSKTVAVIIPDIKNPYFSVILKCMEKIFFAAGYTIALFNTDESADLERDAINACLGRNIDGIIITPTQKSAQNLAYLRQASVPYVLLGRHFEGDSDNYVGHDDIAAGYNATRHLLELGHKNIAFFNADQNIICSNERLHGYKTALKEANVLYDADSVIHLSPTAKEAETSIIAKFFDEHPSCTAVVAFNDLIAFLTAKYLKNIGKCVPEDISVVGVDNILGEFPFPFQLTSVDLSIQDIAFEAAQLLITLLNSKNRPEPQYIKFKTNLVVRGSTAVPKK
ncbi:MAG: LacI family transcriptional regulator [Ruminococcaceae bacterium]|nr:LacI family transcriptional regulator [Oscillospiraceae bacterium]